MIFWKIVFAHLLTDFIFQPDYVAKNKQKIRVLLFHVLILAILTYIVLLPILTFRILYLVLVLSIFHGILDFTKNKIQIKFPKHEIILFVVDQLIHIILIAIFVEIIQKTYFIEWEKFIDITWSNIDVFIIASFVLFILFGGGYFTGFICKKFIKKLDTKLENQGLKNAGRYIGILERGLIIVAVLIGRYEFIGFLLAAKSIARYPEINKELAFAEYFLVGTLTSVSVALFGSLLLKFLIS